MTKRELANRILTLLGINTRSSSADSEEIADTIKHTEDWMLSNNAVGRRIGWVVSSGEPDPDQESGIPDWAVMGVANSMALYMAPYFEKVSVHPSIAMNASLGMQTIASMTVEVQPVQYPSRFPRGQVNQHPHGPRYYQPEDRITTGGDYLTDEGDDTITT